MWRGGGVASAIKRKLTWFEALAVNAELNFECIWLNKINESIIKAPIKQIPQTCSLWLDLQYLLELPDAVLAAEAFLLAINQQEVVGGRAAWQVVTTLLTAVHDQPFGLAVNVETCVAADLMGHSLKADLVSDLQKRKTEKMQKQQQKPD